MGHILIQEEPESPQIKEEKEEQEDVHIVSDGTLHTVKSEDVENRETEHPASSTSATHKQVHAGRKDCHTSQPTSDALLTSSHCSESDTEDSDDWQETSEGQSALHTVKSHRAVGRQRLSVSNNLPLDQKSQKQTQSTTSHTKKKKEQVGPLGGYEYKKNTDGTINKKIVVCTHCMKELKYNRSLTSLKYHLNAKHPLVGDSFTSSKYHLKFLRFVGDSSASSGSCQTTQNKWRPISKSTSDKLTDTIAKWVAKDCRPTCIVEDMVFNDVLRLASLAWTH